MVCSDCESRKIEPNIPKNISTLAPFAAENPRDRNNRIGSIGSSARSSQRTNAASSDAPPISAVEHVGRGPAEGVGAHHGEHHSEQSGACEQHAGDVEAGGRTVALGEPAPRDRRAAAAPIGTLIQKIVCHDQPCTTAPPTSGPLEIARPATAPQAPSAAPRRATGTAAESRVRVSGVTIAARALDRPRDDQPSGGRRERARGRAGGEDREPDDEHAAPAEPLTEAGPGQQQHGEGQRVGVHRPLQRGQRCAQVKPDHRQRGGHDQVVQRGHEQRHAGDHEGPDGAGPCGHPSSLLD